MVSHADSKGSADDFNIQGLRQLHQLVLFHDELGLPQALSNDIRNRSLSAFHSAPRSPSGLQREVCAALRELSARVREEEVTKEGYSLDAIVTWEGQRIAIEIDGPSHFLRGGTDGSATGATLLKRRQLGAFGWRLAVIPYWAWSKLKDSERRQYLLGVLRRETETLKNHNHSSSSSSPSSSSSSKSSSTYWLLIFDNRKKAPAMDK